MKHALISLLLYIVIFFSVRYVTGDWGVAGMVVMCAAVLTMLIVIIAKLLEK